MHLLSREAFKIQVLGRSAGLCVFCTAAAVDAHHILDRKLFSDGGYYLNNGAAVCAQHHWDCETTVLSATDTYAAAGITQPVLPPGFLAECVYDKWGNHSRGDGTWVAGPLIHDSGARRALAASGKLGLIWA
jgi:hypothetical protein